MPTPQRAFAVPYLLVAAMFCGCTGIGPRSVGPDRFDYSETLSTSWKQQMLINMVKLRYGDTPVFLDVASVINQYSIETQVDLRLTWVDPAISVGDSQSTGGSARYSDKPTITYMPMTGERFAQLHETDSAAGAFESDPSGISDRPRAANVHAFGQWHSQSLRRLGRPRPADPDFYPVLERLRRMQNSGFLSLRVDRTNEMEAVVLSMRRGGDESIDEDVAFVRQKLGLDPAAQEFRVAYGSIAKDDKEIAILSRSMLEIIVDLASYIEVPADHVAAAARQCDDGRGSVRRGGDSAADPNLSSSSRPTDAFVSVPYRKYWYRIDDNDLRSKRLFTFLMFVFSLTETQGKESAPIVTIPAG